MMSELRKSPDSAKWIARRLQESRPVDAAEVQAIAAEHEAKSKNKK